MEYVRLSGRLNELSDRLKAARELRDLYQQAAILLERAWVERDLCGPRTRQGERYGWWMRDDVEQADRLAERLEAAIGDSSVFERLLIPFPRLDGVYTRRTLLRSPARVPA